MSSSSVIVSSSSEVSPIDYFQLGFQYGTESGFTFLLLTIFVVVLVIVCKVFK